MKDGDRGPLVGTWVNRFQGDLKQIEPETEAQKASFLQLLEQQDNRTDGRRERLSEANRSIPAPVWFFLVLGAFVTVAFALFFADRREAFIVQGSLIAAIAALVVSGLLLVWFLDHPYENSSGSIKPDEMERQLVIIEGEQKNVALPCDEAGHPVGRAGVDLP